MTKPKIKEARCFEKVARVIGQKNARRELFIASQRKSTQFNHMRNLGSAFLWQKSPQGREFWDCIDKGINPYEQYTIMA